MTVRTETPADQSLFDSFMSRPEGQAAFRVVETIVEAELSTGRPATVDDLLPAVEAQLTADKLTAIPIWVIVALKFLLPLIIRLILSRRDK